MHRTGESHPSGHRLHLGRVVRLLVGVVIIAAALWSPLAGAAVDDDPSAGPVYVVSITGDIDLGLAPYLDRALDTAEDAGAAVVIVEIDTPGGRLDAVLQMSDSLIDSPLRTVALVDATAFSAGALVAIASTEIYMTPGSVMGAATPVDGATGEESSEKIVSAVRATFESVAEERGRDPQVAAAMVDTSVAVDGLIDGGRLLTLTVSQAVEFGYADGVVADRAALLDELGFADREVVEVGLGLAEQLVRIVTNPVVASLMLIVGMLVLIADLFSGGIGAGVVIGVALLALFFWGHMLAGLAGWEDAALIVLGLVLIAVEVFVVPGFGVPGILGLLSLGGGIFLSMVYRDFDFVTDADLVRAGVAVGVVLVATVLGLIALLAVVARGGRRTGLVLQSGLDVAAPVTERSRGGWLRWFDVDARLESDRVSNPTVAPPVGSLVGATGTALSDLRPSGVADIGGDRIDVVTAGDYIRSGEAIEVVVDERYRRVVRRYRA